MMYFLNKHVQDGWEHLYEHFECDADAMKWACNQLSDTCNMVALYRHENEDTCGIKHFIASYE